MVENLNPRNNSISSSFLQLKVANQDDTPIQDGVNKVKIRHGFTYNSEEFQEHEYWIPSNGMIQLEFFPPHREDIHVLNIEVGAVGEPL